MLNYIIFQEKEYQFISKTSSPNETNNIFSIVIGKNGTGKSRLLRCVADTALNTISKASLVPSRSFFESENLKKKQPIFSTTPDRVICSSTNPFDKFLVQKNETKYSYLGIRGLPSENVGKEYLSKIILTLLDSLSKDTKVQSVITSTLQYLGFTEYFEAHFKITSPTLIKNIKENDWNTYKSNSSMLRRSSLNRADFNFVKNIIARNEITPSFKLTVRIERESIDIESNQIQSSLDVAKNLLRLRIIKLHNLHLKKAESRGIFKLEDASSGEQSVVMSLLGISSQISDNSIVCIDEPEVCLHPEWQTRYISLLTKLFSNYKSCHFIIATHSPQIVSQLPISNCYILTMETRVAVSAREFSKKSADYQLATLFKAPGNQNEYVARLCMNILARVSKSKKFSQSDAHELSKLTEILSVMPDNDPMKELIIALNEMLEFYGSDK